MIPAKTAEQIKMLFGEADSLGTYGRHLVNTMNDPSSAAMRAVATINIATCY